MRLVPPATRRRLRQAAVRRAQQFVERFDRENAAHITLDYPTSSANRPRWGYDRPRNELLEAAIARHDSAYEQSLETIIGYRDELTRIARYPADAEPGWLNAWLLPLDTASIYAFLREWKPPRYVEVGSGNSTMVVDRARRDGGLSTHITSIDPKPRAEIDALCDEVVRSPLEDADLSVFTSLSAGDVVFVDCSHRAFMNSDVVAFHLDALPQLPEGVLVGVHDILLPDDYLDQWDEYYFSEQYVLAAYLLSPAEWLQPVLACNYASQHPELAKVIAPLWDELGFTGLERRGFTFWFRIGPR